MTSRSSLANHSNTREDMMSGPRSNNRPILGRKTELHQRTERGVSNVSDLFPDPLNSPLWNSAILFPDSPTLNGGYDKDENTSFPKDLSVYGQWSVGESKRERPEHDSSTHSTACQTEWSFHPRVMVNEPFLPTFSSTESLLSEMEHLTLTKTDDSLFHDSSMSWQKISPSISPTSQKQQSPPTQEKLSVQTERRHCVFCKQNGETKEFYLSHVLKDSKGKVVCPTLRDYVCPICGASGSTAHTISYCPSNKDKRKDFRTLFSKTGKKE